MSCCKDHLYHSQDQSPTLKKLRYDINCSDDHYYLLQVLNLIKCVLNSQMWDALLKVECSIEEVSSRWTQSLTKDLRKRISQVSDCVRNLEPAGR